MESVRLMTRPSRILRIMNGARSQRTRCCPPDRTRRKQEARTTTRTTPPTAGLSNRGQGTHSPTEKATPGSNTNSLQEHHHRLSSQCTDIHLAQIQCSNLVCAIWTTSLATSRRGRKCIAPSPSRHNPGATIRRLISSMGGRIRCRTTPTTGQARARSCRNRPWE